MTPPTPQKDPGPLEKLPDFQVSADSAIQKARPFPPDKVKALKGFAQDRMAAVFSPAISKEVARERSRRGLQFADPKDVAKVLEEIKADALKEDGTVLSDAQAREIAIARRTFDHLYPHGELDILQQRGLAGQPVVLDRANTGAWNPDPNKAIGALIPDKPGVYVFAVARANLMDHGSLQTIVIEKRADGSTTVLAGGSFQDPRRDVKDAVDAPILNENPSRHGSRAVVVYPLNPAPAK